MQSGVITAGYERSGLERPVRASHIRSLIDSTWERHQDDGGRAMTNEVTWGAQLRLPAQAAALDRRQGAAGKLGGWGVATSAWPGCPPGLTPIRTMIPRVCTGLVPPLWSALPSM